MKVILTEDVSPLGKSGELRDVANGYARNYLIPKKHAVKASEGALKQAEAMRQARITTEKQTLSDAKALADSLTGTRVVVAARAGDAGNLFGSIGAHDIAEAIVKFTGVEVDTKIVAISSPIKEIGLHEVVLKPHPEVEVSITLDVIPA